MFFVYVDVTYEIESYLGERRLAAETKSTPDFIEQHSFLPRIRLLLLLPIDLICFSLMASLFGVLLVFGTRQSFWSGPSSNNSLEVVYLFSITCAWHLACIGWWIVYGLTAGAVLEVWKDIGQHFGFASLDFFMICVVRSLRLSKWGIRNSGTVAWISTSLFSIILIVLYATRLWDYSERFLLLVFPG